MVAEKIRSSVATGIRRPFPCEERSPQGIENHFIGQEITHFSPPDPNLPLPEPRYSAYAGRGGFHSHIVTQRIEEGVRIARRLKAQQEERAIAEQRFRKANP